MSPGVMTVVINMCRHYGEVPLIDMNIIVWKQVSKNWGLRLVNFVDHKVQSPSEVLWKSFGSPKIKIKPFEVGVIWMMVVTAAWTNILEEDVDQEAAGEDENWFSKI